VSSFRNCATCSGHVEAKLRIGPVAEPEGAIRVDALDHCFGIGERVTGEHLASFLHDALTVRCGDMAKVKTTVYVDEDVLRKIRVSAARRGRTVSELVEDALRMSTLSGLIESIRSRSDLSEEEALELAYSELHAMRRERDQPAA